jgi:integrase
MEAPKDAWLFQRQGTKVEMWGRDNDPKRDRQPIKGYSGVWRTACRRSGVENRVPHDFRRTAVRNLTRAGVPEKIAMSLTGHLTRAILDRYDIVSDEDHREAMQKLAGRHAEQMATVAQIPRLPQFQPQSNEMTLVGPAQKAENA